MPGPRPILLVEDEEDDVFIMRRVLSDLGLQLKLQVVHNGDQAIAYLNGDDGFADRLRFPWPEVVFLDLKMPGRNGFDVLSWRQEQARLAIPFAVLSSSGEDQDVRRARELGADCYLVKPPTKAMLQDCLTRFGLLRSDA